MFRALPFFLPAVFGDPPFRRLRELGLFLRVGLHQFSLAALLAFGEFLCAVVAHAGISLHAHRLFVDSGVSLLIVVGHGLAPFCRRASAGAGGHARNGSRGVLLAMS